MEGQAVVLMQCDCLCTGKEEPVGQARLLLLGSGFWLLPVR